MKKYQEWQIEKELSLVTEDTSLAVWTESTSSRYSIEVNFRSKIKEILEAYAKISLGYVSAAMKQNGFHIKHVFDVAPIRILVSSRNWDDGEWVGCIYFHPEHEGGSFILSKGFYNKDVKSISLQSRTKCKGDSAAELTKELRQLMHDLKDKPDRHTEKFKKIPLKRGPKG